MNSKKSLTRVILALIVLATAYLASAEPNGPSAFEIRSSERGYVETAPPGNASAMAGNVTELVINITTITKSWAGFFGNISGKITLDDASNWTLYDWQYSNPQGKIYAARIDSVTWSNISCMRFNSNGSLYPNLTTEIDYMGASASDGDSIDRTFAVANHSQLTIGTVQINADTCNTTFLYINDTTQNTQFREVLLTDNTSNNSIIYTAILEQDQRGFNNRSMDFEIIVGENGHGNSATTPYYFWVELE